MINRQMDATRSSLCEKLETLEQKVVGTVSGAQAAVAETVGSVKESVTDTVNAVTGTVRDTVESVRDAFDIRQHVERHPCLSMGAAVGAGFLLGRWLEGNEGAGPRSVFTDLRSSGATSAAESANGQSYAKARTTPVDAETIGARQEKPRDNEGPGWVDSLRNEFGTEIDKIKAMAVGSGIGLLRDLLIRSVPPQFKQGLTDVMDRVTTKLGGESFQPGSFASERSARDKADVV